MARRTNYLSLPQRFVKMMPGRWQTQRIRSLDRGPGPSMREHSLEDRTHGQMQKLTARKKDKTPRRTDTADTMKHQRDSPLRLLCFTSGARVGGDEDPGAVFGKRELAEKEQTVATAANPDDVARAE